MEKSGTSFEGDPANGTKTEIKKKHKKFISLAHITHPMRLARTPRLTYLTLLIPFCTSLGSLGHFTHGFTPASMEQWHHALPKESFASHASILKEVLPLARTMRSEHESHVSIVHSVTIALSLRVRLICSSCLDN